MGLGFQLFRLLAEGRDLFFHRGHITNLLQPVIQQLFRPGPFLLGLFPGSSVLVPLALQLGQGESSVLRDARGIHLRADLFELGIERTHKLLLG